MRHTHTIPHVYIYTHAPLHALSLPLTPPHTHLRTYSHTALLTLHHTHTHTHTQDDPHVALVLDVIKDDSLRKQELRLQSYAHHCIITGSKLIAPTLDPAFTVGFDLCIDEIRTSQYAELAVELEISKAISHLKMKDFSKAMEALKAFEKKDAKMQAAAATNLAFLYYLVRVCI